MEDSPLGRIPGEHRNEMMRHLLVRDRTVQIQVTCPVATLQHYEDGHEDGVFDAHNNISAAFPFLVELHQNPRRGTLHFPGREQVPIPDVHTRMPRSGLPEN